MHRCVEAYSRRGIASFRTSVAVLLAGATVCWGATRYIAADGDDANDGLSPAAPWRTLAMVNANQNDGDAFLFQRGDVFRGQIEVEYDNTTWDAYGTGTYPVISGSVLITNWVPHTGSIYVAHGVTNTIHHLFADDALMTIARYPNADAPGEGWLQSETSSNLSTLTHSQLAAYGKPDGYFTGATVRIRPMSWLFNDRTVVAYDGTTGTVTMNADVDEHPAASIMPGWGFYLDGILGELDTTNEWLYDAVNQDVYLWAPGGVDPNTLKVEGMTFDFGITMFWQIDDTLIQNLMFKHQADSGVRIWICHDTTVRSNAFKHCREYGVRIPWDSSNVVVAARDWGLICSMIEPAHSFGEAVPVDFPELSFILSETPVRALQ